MMDEERSELARLLKKSRLEKETGESTGVCPYPLWLKLFRFKAPVVELQS